MYGTITQIQVTPDQLTELIRGAVRSELANYTPPTPVGSELPELLTRKQTANALQVSLTTLHSWSLDTTDRGAILVPQRMGGRVRYHRTDVLATLKEVRRFKNTGSAGEGSGRVS